MLMRHTCFIFVFLLLSIIMHAAQVDTLEVYSACMYKSVKVLVIFPDSSKMEKKCKSFPVVYLLHGYSGGYRSWLAMKPNLPDLAEFYQMIFVCPDAKNSWYWDAPLKPEWKYETFISKELVPYIDANYSTRPFPEGRAITGFSMGGHGAFRFACRYTDIWGAVGSTSGGLDVRPFSQGWEMDQLLGDIAMHPEVWDEYTAITQIDRIKKKDLAIIFDCGKEDVFLKVNLAMHECLWKKGIEHDFIIREGGHTHEYWRNAIDYQLLFFHKFFQKIVK